jgi:hypothetical protein
LNHHTNIKVTKTIIELTNKKRLGTEEYVSECIYKTPVRIILNAENERTKGKTLGSTR